MKKAFLTKQFRLFAILVSVALTLAVSVPAIAEYIGPNRTVTTYYTYWWYPVPGQGGCSVFSPPPEAFWNYELACLNFSGIGPCSCEGYYQAYQDNLVEAMLGEQTTTHPPATISGALQCSKYGNNGWCISPATLSLAGSEPLAGYNIITLEGTRNGQPFSCIGSSCPVALLEGNNDFTFWALSSWGDSSLMGTISGKVDTRFPQINGNLTGVSGSNGWFVSDVTLAASVVDPSPGSGIAAFDYSVGSGSWASYTNSITISDGTFTLNFQAMDRAGNKTSINQTVMVDTLPPNLTIDSMLPDGLNGWYIHPPLLTTIANDITSGLMGVTYRVDGGSWINASQVLVDIDGLHSVTFHAIDWAGNITAMHQVVGLDTTQPNVAFSMPVVPPSGWYTLPVVISLDASDETSGISFAEISADGGITWQALVTLTDGSHSLLARAGDQAGNQASATTIIQVDTQPPMIQTYIAGDAGQNGWYTSPVTLTIDPSDHGSGVALTEYRVGGADWQAGTVIDLDANGVYSMEMRAIDLAGNQSSTATIIQIDKDSPVFNATFTGETGQNDWYTSPVTMEINAKDIDSGVALIEYRVDDAAWQPGTVVNLGINGIHSVDVRVNDFAGNESTGTYQVKVDTDLPQVSLSAPGSFCSVCEKITITYVVRGSTSDIAEWNLFVDDSFVLASGNDDVNESYVWDASNLSLGNHILTLNARDQAGKTVRIDLPVNLLPPPTTPTPKPPTPTSTPILPTPTSTPIPPATPYPTPTKSSTPANNSTPNPTISTVATATPVPSRSPSTIVFGASAPTMSHADEAGFSSSGDLSGGGSSSVLWGATAAAISASVTAYAVDQQRKRKEEEERQRAMEEARAAQWNESQQQKWEAAQQLEKLRQEQLAAWRAAQAEQSQPPSGKLSGMLEEAEERLNDVINGPTPYQIFLAQQAEKYKNTRIARMLDETEEMVSFDTSQNAAFYAAQSNRPAPKKQDQQTKQVTPATQKKPWWEKTLDWIDNHQPLVSVGVGVLIGVASVAAIVLSGGLATPLVVAAVAGAAALTAETTVAIGTVALNRYYERPWYTGIIRNTLLAGNAAAFTTLIGSATLFLAPKVIGGVGSAATAFCGTKPEICSRAEAVLGYVDVGEQLWLMGKLVYQTAKGDQDGAFETVVDAQMEQADAGLGGNTIAKEVDDVLDDVVSPFITHMDDVWELVNDYGDDILPLLFRYGDDAIYIISVYEDEGISMLWQYKSTAASLLSKYGDDALDLLQTYGDDAVKWVKTLENLVDEDVFEYVIEQGPDAVKAFSHWPEHLLREHGEELALRASSDAVALEAAEKLAKLGELNSPEARELIETIAYYSVQGNGNRLVLGKWIEGSLDEGFMGVARADGSLFYGTNPGLSEIFKGINKPGGPDPFWEVNEQVLQIAVDFGWDVDYSLSGIDPENTDDEIEAIYALVSGATEDEVKELLPDKKFPFRFKELQFLIEHGYKLEFDDAAKIFHWLKP